MKTEIDKVEDQDKYHYWLYVLRLEQGKYYIGSSSVSTRRTQKMKHVAKGLIALISRTLTLFYYPISNTAFPT